MITSSVYLQKEGGTGRTVLFQDYMSDRDPDFVDVIPGGNEARSG